MVSFVYYSKGCTIRAEGRQDKILFKLIDRIRAEGRKDKIPF